MNDEFENMVLGVMTWYDEICENSPQDALDFKNCSEDDLISYHHTLGSQIRNEYKLWNVKWEPELIEGIDYSPNHPDSISMNIIIEVWKRIQ